MHRISGIRRLIPGLARPTRATYANSNHTSLLIIPKLLNRLDEKMVSMIKRLYSNHKSSADDNEIEDSSDGRRTLTTCSGRDWRMEGGDDEGLVVEVEGGSLRTPPSNNTRCNTSSSIICSDLEFWLWVQIRRMGASSFLTEKSTVLPTPPNCPNSKQFGAACFDRSTRPWTTLLTECGN